MQYSELSNNVSNMFPQERGESSDHYQFFLNESMKITDVDDEANYLELFEG